MRDDHTLAAGGGDGLHQARPVGMVREHEAAVHAASAARAAQLHPAACEGVAGADEAPRPDAAGHAGRRQYERLLELGLVGRLRHQARRRQGDARFTIGAVERLDGAMHEDRADARVDSGEQALRLAEAVAHEQAWAARLDIAAPPCVDRVEHLALRPPAVDRQAKGGLGDEAVAALRLEGRAGAVVVARARNEVIARCHPHAPSVLEPHLRRAQHMACGVQRHTHAEVVDALAVSRGLQGNRTQPRPQHALPGSRRQIGAVTDTRMVGVGVGDDGARHRPPRVDVEIAGRAIQALGALDQEIGRGHSSLFQ